MRIFALLMYTSVPSLALVIHRGGLPSSSEDIEGGRASIFKGRFAEICKEIILLKLCNSVKCILDVKIFVFCRRVNECVSKKLLGHSQTTHKDRDSVLRDCKVFRSTEDFYSRQEETKREMVEKGGEKDMRRKMLKIT